MRLVLIFVILQIFSGCVHFKPPEEKQDLSADNCYLFIIDECNSGMVGEIVCFKHHKIIKEIPIFRNKPEQCAEPEHGTVPVFLRKVKVKL